MLGTILLNSLGLDGIFDNEHNFLGLLNFGKLSNFSSVCMKQNFTQYLV